MTGEPLACKTCTRCKLTKPVSEFNRHQKAYDGYNQRCRECTKELNAYWRVKRTPEQVAKDKARWRYKPEWRDDPQLRVLYNQRYHLLAMGLTPEDYLELLASQGGVCAACGTDAPGGKYKRFAIDHDHLCCPGSKSCGKCVRGLLCITCNVVAGHLESPRTQAVMDYLARTRER